MDTQDYILNPYDECCETSRYVYMKESNRMLEDKKKFRTLKLKQTTPDDGALFHCNLCYELKEYQIINDSCNHVMCLDCTLRRYIMGVYKCYLCYSSCEKMIITNLVKSNSAEHIEEIKSSYMVNEGALTLFEPLLSQTPSFISTPLIYCRNIDTRISAIINDALIYKYKKCIQAGEEFTVVVPFKSQDKFRIIQNHL